MGGEGGGLNDALRRDNRHGNGATAVAHNSKVKRERETEKKTVRNVNGR